MLTKPLCYQSGPVAVERELLQVPVGRKLLWEGSELVCFQLERRQRRKGTDALIHELELVIGDREEGEASEEEERVRQRVVDVGVEAERLPRSSSGVSICTLVLVKRVT
jgi:hypothetical protein